MAGVKERHLELPTVLSAGFSIVIRGHFNPPIFQPYWLAAHKLITESEAETAEIEGISPAQSVFAGQWFHMATTKDRLQIRTESLEDLELLRDLGKGILRVLDQTPVAVLGLNYDTDVELGSSEEWHAFGDRLAPKEPWGGSLHLPGTEALVMRAVRTDSYGGYIRVLVQPSDRVATGVRLEHNDHFLLQEVDQQPSSRSEFSDWRASSPDTVAPSAERIPLAISILSHEWDESISRAKRVVHQLLGV